MTAQADRRRERSLRAAQGYLDLQMPDHALRELKAVRDPECCLFEINQLRAEALRQNNEHDEALAAFQKALDEKPSDLTTLLGMAWCYKRIDQLQRAVATMEEAYQTAPKEPIVIYNLACYFALSGDKTQALSWLGRALRMEGSLRKLIADESDFDSLRHDPDFQFVTGAHDTAQKE